MQIGRVAARATYTPVDEDEIVPGITIAETGRLDDLLVCLHSRYVTGEIENVVLTIGETRMPADIVHEVFSALSVMGKRP